MRFGLVMRIGFVLASLFMAVPLAHGEAVASDNSGLPFVEWPDSGSESWMRSWSVAVADALDKPQSGVLLNRDISIEDDLLFRICPNYNALNRTERKVFWAHMFASMALHESSFDPYCTVENDGGGNDSIGLLQLSYEDGEWARSWGFEARSGVSSLALTNAEVNLRSGVAIMARQVSSAQKMFVDYDEGIYWAVLAPSFIADRPGYNVVRTFNSYRDGNLDFCD
jgi:hypothetical protein